MLLRQFCKLHFVTKQFHVNRCTLLFLLQRIKYKALSRSYQYFLRCRQKVNEQLVSRYLLNKNFHDSVSVYVLWKGVQSFLPISKALYNEGWMRGSWTLPLVWPLFFVTFPLVWPLFFVDLFLAFPWYGPYFSWPSPWYGPCFSWTFSFLFLGMAPIFVSLTSLSIRSFIFKKVYR